jgi:hypothetical protein
MGKRRGEPVNRFSSRDHLALVRRACRENWPAPKPGVAKEEVDFAHGLLDCADNGTRNGIGLMLAAVHTTIAMAQRNLRDRRAFLESLRTTLATPTIADVMRNRDV